MKSIIVVSLAVMSIVSFASEVANGEDRFSAKIQEIEQEVDKWYDEQADSEWESMPKSSEAHSQSVDSRLPKQVINILQIGLGMPESRMVDMTNVREVVAGLEQHDQGTQDDFLSNIGSYLVRLLTWAPGFPEYASDSDVDSDSESESEPLSEDERAARSWLNYVKRKKDGMCFGFRGKNDENIIGQMISELRELKQTENIDDKKFNELVVNVDRNIAPVYSAAFFCQVIDNIVAGGKMNGEVTLEINSSGARSTFSSTPFLR